MFLSSITAQVAYATCGDYLMMPGEEHAPLSGSDHEGPAPCNGPSCRGAPQAPLPTAPERSFNYDLERWCASLADDVHSAEFQSHLDIEESLLIPAGYASRIDRPPRG